MLANKKKDWLMSAGRLQKDPGGFWFFFYFDLVSGAGTIRHGGTCPSTFGMARHEGAQKEHHLKHVTHQVNTSWSSPAFDKVAAGGAVVPLHQIRLHVIVSRPCVGWKHTCELRWASRDWTACWYCTTIRTEQTNWTWRPFLRNLSVHLTIYLGNYVEQS